MILLIIIINGVTRSIRCPQFSLLTSSNPYQAAPKSSAETMACLSSAALVVPQFAGLKAGSRTAAPTTVAAAAASAAPRAAAMTVKASLKDAGAVLLATAASAVLAGSALAIDVKLGGDDGSLAFEPKEFSIAAGEKIVFKNNAGFPHNVVFDEDEVPAGVDASAISMSDEDLLNAPGEVYSVVLKEKGTYKFYCSPHQGAGMAGQVTVN